jgi:hypothetical protein
MKMKVIWYMEASDEKIKPHFKASEFQCKDKTEGLLVAADLVNILLIFAAAVARYAAQLPAKRGPDFPG